VKVPVVGKQSILGEVPHLIGVIGCLAAPAPVNAVCVIPPASKQIVVRLLYNSAAVCRSASPRPTAPSSGLFKIDPAVLHMRTSAYTAAPLNVRPPCSLPLPAPTMFLGKNRLAHGFRSSRRPTAST